MWWKRAKQREFIEVPDKKRDWRPRVNYSWIVNHLPFLLFLFVLAILYIANGHYAVKNIREINALQTQVKELHWHYLDQKSKLMFRSKMSEVSGQVAPYGLKVANTPPLIIKEEDRKDKK